MKFFGNLNMYINYKCYFSLSYVGAVDVSASKMFLIDHASVSRILILAFFVLIVILGAFMTLNLILAAIMHSYLKEDEKRKK